MARMKPKQIHLSEDDLALLTAESARTGASHSELIRRAVREKYAPAPKRPLSFVGMFSDGRWSSDTIDDELAAIYEERRRRWHG